MSTELVKLSGSEIMSMGKAFHESGMFPDIKTAAQAVVKIQAGAEIGIPPFAAMSGIHIIQGKPTIGAGLIASAVKGSGKYDYRVIEQTEKNCNIDFFQGKEKLGTSSFSIEDAKKAQTKNLDKFPKNMLFARAISNGVKWYCPDVFSGPVYVPEEMPEVTEDISHNEVKTVTNNTTSASDFSSQLTDATAGLESCSTENELKTYKKTLAPEVIKHPDFVKAGTDRYKKIMA